MATTLSTTTDNSAKILREILKLRAEVNRLSVQMERSVEVPDRWISVKEAAKQLNVSQGRVRELLNAGKIGCTRIGLRKLSVSFNSVQEFMRNQ